jgi:hypothetical protein
MQYSHNFLNKTNDKIIWSIFLNKTNDKIIWSKKNLMTTNISGESTSQRSALVRSHSSTSTQEKYRISKKSRNGAKICRLPYGGERRHG